MDLFQLFVRNRDMKMLRTTIPFIILTVAIVAIVALLWHPNASGGYDENDPGYNRTYWTNEFNTKEAKAVYEEFKERNGHASSKTQHLSAHVMGELIYSALGVEGITVCDASFGFGCYHGFFGRAISEGGETRIKELDEACVAAYGELGTGCQHGIGHGVMEYVGYNRVNDALALCKETTQLVPLLGCTSGVFMEYYSPLAGVGDGLVPSVREFDETDPYQPCTTVSAEFSDSCYYQLGQWLAPKTDGEATRIGDVCSSLSEHNRAQCFLGAGGVITYMVEGDVTRARAVCASFGEAGDVACRAGVSWALYADPAYRASAPAACADENSARQAQCQKLSDLTDGLEPH